MLAEGGMSMPDLEELIGARIPENRSQLETSHANLDNVAEYCKQNYIEKDNKSQALAETKRFAIQSLASVAFQINTMTTNILDMLELQTDKVNSLTNQVQYVSQVVDIHKEKMARREIGMLTTNKSIFKEPKIVAPAVQEPRHRYQRTPIDYSVLDDVGHGCRTIEPSRSNLISRAASSISGSSPSNYHNESPAYGVFGGGVEQRTATLGRSMMRQGYTPSIVPSDYRVPQISGMTTRQISHGSDFNDQMSGGGGSQHGSNDYNSMYTPDRYGTIRAQNRPNLLPSDNNSTTRLSSNHSSGGGHDSPTFPLPPPIVGGYEYIAPGSVMKQHQQMHQEKYGTIRRIDLPPPPMSLLASSMHEDDLPPPPASIGEAYGVFGVGGGATAAGGDSSDLFDVSANDWVPAGEYIEKVTVLYDYEAMKNDELTLREGATVYVLRKNDDGWYEGVLDGVTGLFPGNYVQPISS